MNPIVEAGARTLHAYEFPNGERYQEGVYEYHAAAIFDSMVRALSDEQCAKLAPIEGMMDIDEDGCEQWWYGDTESFRAALLRAVEVDDG